MSFSLYSVFVSPVMSPPWRVGGAPHPNREAPERVYKTWFVTEYKFGCYYYYVAVITFHWSSISIVYSHKHAAITITTTQMNIAKLNKIPRKTLEYILLHDTTETTYFRYSGFPQCSSIPHFTAVLPVP